MKIHSDKKFKPAFSIIEVLVSVVILSTSILFVLRLYSSNHEQIVYISERNNHMLNDSLFLLPEIEKHHTNHRDAYTLLAEHFKIKTDKSKKALKKIERKIFIPEPVSTIPAATEEGTKNSFSTILNQVMLKKEHSTIYSRIQVAF
ncbi:MAG: hypothetical protein ABXS92_06660 [Sulfurimonas sp.]